MGPHQQETSSYLLCRASCCYYGGCNASHNQLFPHIGFQERRKFTTDGSLHLQFTIYKLCLLADFCFSQTDHMVQLLEQYLPAALNNLTHWHYVV